MMDDMKKCGFPVKNRLFEQETYYAGEIISFGDMEDTCAASKDITSRFF